MPRKAQQTLTSTTGATKESQTKKNICNCMLELLQDHPEQAATANQWRDHKYNSKWQESLSQLCKYIKDVSNNPTKMTLPRPSWVKLNGLKLFFCATMQKRKMAFIPTCKCAVKEQSAYHI